MGKAYSSWSGMRKYLEKEMIAESLKGRVRYNCTRYVGMDNCHIFELYIDGILIKQFSWETVNSYFIKEGYSRKQNPMTIGEYWQDFWDLLDKYPIMARTEYTDEEFCNALEEYRNKDIQDSIRSQNPIVKMFALLDKRVGRRTLKNMEQEMELAPAWVKSIYFLRVAGGIG